MPTQQRSNAKIIRTGITPNPELAALDAKLGLSEIGRDASVLDDDVWRLVDEEVVAILREQAWFPEILNKLGITKEEGSYGRRRLDVWEIDDSLAATVEAGLGSFKGGTVLRKRNTVPIMSVYVDVQTDPLDLEASRHGLMDPLDALNIREATEVVNDQVNKLLAKGSTDEGLDGTLNRTSRQTFVGNDWTTAGNAIKDFRGMHRRLLDKDVPETAKRYVFATPTNHEEAQQELTSTEGSQIEVAKRAKIFEEIIPTNRATTGTATMVALSRSWMRHVVTQPVKVSELGMIGMAPIFRVWTRQTLFNGKANTVVDATSI